MKPYIGSPPPLILLPRQVAYAAIEARAISPPCRSSVFAFVISRPLRKDSLPHRHDSCSRVDGVLDVLPPEPTAAGSSDKDWKGRCVPPKRARRSVRSMMTNTVQAGTARSLLAEDWDTARFCRFVAGPSSIKRSRASLSRGARVTAFVVDKPEARVAMRSFA